MCSASFSPFGVNAVGIFAVIYLHVFQPPGVKRVLPEVILHGERSGFSVRRYAPKAMHPRFAVQRSYLESVVGKIFRFTEECRDVFIRCGHACALLVNSVRRNPYLADHDLLIRIQGSIGFRSFSAANAVEASMRVRKKLKICFTASLPFRLHKTEGYRFIQITSLLYRFF